MNMSPIRAALRYELRSRGTKERCHIWEEPSDISVDFLIDPSKVAIHILKSHEDPKAIWDECFIGHDDIKELWLIDPASSTGSVVTCYRDGCAEYGCSRLAPCCFDPDNYIDIRRCIAQVWDVCGVA